MQKLNEKQVRSLKRKVSTLQDDNESVKKNNQELVGTTNTVGVDRALTIADESSKISLKAIDVISKQNNDFCDIIDKITQSKNVTLKVNRDSQGLINTINITQE